jgi:MFS family permease
MALTVKLELDQLRTAVRRDQAGLIGFKHPVEGLSIVQPEVKRQFKDQLFAQFALLVVVSAFVGGMVGLERAVLPLVAEQDFGLASRAAILSFVATFGVVKALSNLFAGRLSDRIGRKGVLIAGWLIGIPAPILVMVAPSWGWVVAANVLLGVNQGLCWSTTVIMKIDLVGRAGAAWRWG